MSYLGGFMGGSPDYNGNPGILGLYQFVQSGYDAGKAKAQNQALAQLSQKAYTDTGDAQKQDIAQAIGIDPQTGYALAEKAQAQQATQQAQQLQLLQRYGKASSAILQAKQSGDDAAAEGIYQGMLPELRMHAAQTGQPEPPPTLDASVMPTVYKLASMYASIPQAQKGVVIAAGGELVNPTTGAKMASVPNKGQVVSGYYFDPNTGAASPIPIKGAQNGMGMGAAVPGTRAGTAPQAPGLSASVPGTNGQNVTFDFPPGTPPEVIAAAKASAVANGDIAPGQQVGAPQVAPQAQPQTLAQVVVSKGAGAGNAPAGYQWNAAHTGLEAIPGGPADKTQVAAALGDPQLKGQAYLSSIQDKGMQALVKAIAEGREQVPRIYRSQKAGEIGATAIAAAVAQYDPTFNAQDYNSRNRTRIAFTSGKPYQDMMALSQAAKHVGQLVPLINQLAGHAVPFVGGYINAAENKADDVYSGKLTSWNTVADAVAHETRKVFAGSSGGTLSELDGYLKNLSPNSSVAQKQAAVQGIAGLLESRIGLLRDAYAQGMGKAGDPFYTTFPESATTLQYLTSLPQDKVGVAPMPQMPQSSYTVQPNGQQPAPAAAGAHVAVNPQTGERVQLINGQWVPMGGGNGQ